MKRKLLRVFVMVAIAVAAILNASAVAHATSGAPFRPTEPSESAAQSPTGSPLEIWQNVFSPSAVLPEGLDQAWQTHYDNMYRDFLEDLQQGASSPSGNRTNTSDWDAYASSAVMDNIGWDVYTFLRDKIAVPILIVSVAANGFSILGSAFLSNPNALDAVKKRLATAILAFIVLMVLPSIFSLVVDLLKSTAWKPPRP